MGNNEHHPDCPIALYANPADAERHEQCCCEPLRACEQRRDEMHADANRISFKNGFEQGVAAAKAAVREEGDGSATIPVGVAIAVIDALTGDANG